MTADGAGKRRIATTAARAPIDGSAASHGPLLDAIAASPDDTAPWAVYADLLQTDDHPRGELIALMLERESRPSRRLFEIQRRFVAAHASALLPAALPAGIVVGWRRGFASEVTLSAPEQLAAVQQDATLRFVRAATLVVDGRWPEWRAALAAAALPWRRLRIDAARAAAPVDVAAILAGCPAVETLRIAAPPEGLRWESARAEQLRSLVLVDAGEVESLDAAALPRLEELQLLGGSDASDELRTSLHWSRLQRVVLAHGAGADDDSTPRIDLLVPTGRIERTVADADDEDDWVDDDERDTSHLTTAFIVVGRTVEAAVLRKLAERMSIAHLSARIATPRWLPQPMTVIQLFGTADAELLPYGLAVALHAVLEAAPIALVEVEGDLAARFLVLGDPPTRGTQPDPAGEVQRALDLALGFDPGAAALQDLLDELGATPVVPLAGNGGTSQLVMIDPSTAPLVVVPEDGEYENAGDDEDDYEDEEGLRYDDGLAEQYEEPVVLEDDADELPVPVAAAAAIPIAPVEVDVDADMFIVLDGELEPFARLPADDEDALVAPPEDTELWLEFREHWDDRAVAVDDEPGELRWPDPAHADDVELIFERQVAEPECLRHGCALEHCACGARYCTECGDDERCASCVAVAAERAVDEPVPVTRVVV